MYGRRYDISRWRKFFDDEWCLTTAVPRQLFLAEVHRDQRRGERARSQQSGDSPFDVTSLLH